MKFGIAQRLALLLAAVGLAAAAVTAVLAERISRTLLIDSAQESLLTANQVLGQRMRQVRESIARDLRIVASHPLAVRALRDDPQAADQLADWFTASMRTQPAYFQMRLIGAADYGLERVRVDRDRGELVRVNADALQEKGHYPYVSRTLQLPDGEVFLSSIVINHEDGAHDGLNRPSIILAMPVHDGGAQAIGAVVINVDLRGTFALLAQDLPSSYELYLANGHGDILLHPDEARTFGFDRGQRQLIQTEMPALNDVVAGTAQHALFDFADSTANGRSMVAAFLRVDARQAGIASDERALILGLAKPAVEVLERAEQLRRQLLLLILPVTAACLLVALVLARSFTRPLGALEHAARHFGEDLEGAALPVGRSDEIGTLARSFEQMQQRINDQLGTLQDNQQALEHLSQHDSLTGLPNRRFFMQLLEQALANARRHGRTADVMFIDLDGFKPVNDQHGHDAGDAVLRTVAERLRSALREADVLARLGGDEFVVLLEGELPLEARAAMATKVIEVVSQPIPVSEDGLTVNVGASIGLAHYPDDGSTAAELLQRADQAMYAAKDAGRGQLRFATEA